MIVFFRDNEIITFERDASVFTDFRDNEILECEAL